MKNCPICGYPGLTESEKRCPACGNSLHETQTGRSNDVVTEAIAYVKKATVCVSAYWNSVSEGSVRKGSTGTGFFVRFDKETYLVTNCHVVVDKGQLADCTTVIFSEEVSRRKNGYNAKILTVDGVNDLAILRMYSPAPNGAQVLELEDLENLRQGDRVITVGNPLGYPFDAVEGSVSSLEWMAEGMGMSRILCTLSATHGNSGGAVVKVSDRKVIGILTAGFSPDVWQSHVIVVSADAIRQIIYQARSEQKNS